MNGPDNSASKASWRCRLGMHAYNPTVTDDGAKYLVCARCGKEDFPGSSYNTLPNG